VTSEGAAKRASGNPASAERKGRDCSSSRQDKRGQRGRQASQRRSFGRACSLSFPFSRFPVCPRPSPLSPFLSPLLRWRLPAAAWRCAARLRCCCWFVWRVAVAFLPHTLADNIKENKAVNYQRTVPTKTHRPTPQKRISIATETEPNATTRRRQTTGARPVTELEKAHQRAAPQSLPEVQAGTAAEGQRCGRGSRQELPRANSAGLSCCRCH
jgi:hypothetical protein